MPIALAAKKKSPKRHDIERIGEHLAASWLAWKTCLVDVIRQEIMRCEKHGEIEQHDPVNLPLAGLE
jgi:hypothetical protein